MTEPVDEPAGTLIPYRLVLSRVRVTGTLVTTRDPFDGDASKVQDVHVEVVQQGDTRTETRSVRTAAGTHDIGVSVTADGRLQSVQHRSVGAGAAVVSAGAKLVGFVGGAVLTAVTRGGALAGEEGEEPPPPPTPPRQKWAADHEAAADLLRRNKALAQTASHTLVELRTQLVASSELATVRSLNARIEVVARTLHAARAEVGRIESVYAAWRAQQTQTRSAKLECLVDLDQLAARAAGTAPSPAPDAPQDDAPGYALWRDFRLILEVVDPRHDASTPRTDTPTIGAVPEDRMVRWRVPRTIELWLWSQPDAEAELTLVTRTPVTVVDHRSDTYGMEMRAEAFGDHGGTWTFGEVGAPTAITTAQTSLAGALADAFGSVPEQLVGGLDQARKLADSVAGVQDAAAEREKSAAERDLATAKARIDLLGLDATEEDAAALARADQAVKLRTASRALAPGASTLEDLKFDLERVTTQNSLDSARRTAALESQLVDVKAEVARLEQEVLIAQAAYDRLHPADERE